MEENTTLFGDLLDKIEDFTKTTIELVKLKAVDKLVSVASNIVSGVIFSILVFFFLLAFNMAIAFWIGEALGKFYLGFFIVAGFYVLLIIILAFFKNKIIRAPLTNVILKKFLK